MKITKLDGIMLRKIIIGASNELTRNKQLLDELNVFPVPDGDTGTNMSLTVQVAAREVEKMNTPNAYDVAKTASSGSLRGARGNSGVILSQLFRGFAKGFEGKAIINTEDLAEAFVQASETAYKAVMKPKEGTILTVASAMGDKAAQLAVDMDDIEDFLEAVIKRGNEVLSQTTQMLPQLKAAGVVDAGGKGLMCILEGALNSLRADGEITLNTDTEKKQTATFTPAAAGSENIEFGYCTEFFINVPAVTDEAENRLKNFLQTIGDSIVVVGDEDIFKVHVHTEHPGSVLEFALKVGTLSNLKIENMRIQHSNLINFVSEKSETQAEQLARPPEEMGFVAIAAGGGIAAYFEGLGVDIVIEGGQTMNPSIDDILAAVSKVNANNIFILPNNKNIILAANQAAELTTDKKVLVLPTKTVPQGIAAMVEYLPNRSVGDNFDSMKEAITRVKTGQMTYAVRDTFFEEKEIKEGNILCMLEGNIALVHTDVQEGAKQLLEMMLKDGGDILSIYYGEETAEEAAQQLFEYATENFPDIEVECRSGEQPLYYYIFSVE